MYRTLVRAPFGGGISSLASLGSPDRLPCVRGIATGVLSDGTSTSLKPSRGDGPRLSVRYDGPGKDRSMPARHGISIGVRRGGGFDASTSTLTPVAFPVPGRVAARELTPEISLDRLAGITIAMCAGKLVSSVRSPNYLSQVICKNGVFA